VSVSVCVRICVCEGMQAALQGAQREQHSSFLCTESGNKNLQLGHQKMCDAVPAGSFACCSESKTTKK